MTAVTVLISAILAVGGPSFLEPLQKRDSVLVWDQFRYGIELKAVEEGTPLLLPILDKEATEKNLLAFIEDWHIDSLKVSHRRDSIARYNLRAYLTLAPMTGGEYTLFPIKCVVGKDTLEFTPQMLMVTEPSIDMETFVPNDIKPQEKFPVTFAEAAPWTLIGIFALGIILMLGVILKDARGRKAEEIAREPAHIRALRKLETFRSSKFWKPEQQKTFYSGVTDALREYIASRFGFGAMEMTTAEIFDALKDSPDLSPELYNDTLDLFERADFVKFAKHTATDEENASVIPVAVRFVSSTYLEEIQKEEEE